MTDETTRPSTDHYDDAEWSRMYCAYLNLRYLSHERYGNTLRIAVEEPGDRFEISVEHATPSTVGDGA